MKLATDGGKWSVAAGNNPFACLQSIKSIYPLHQYQRKRFQHTTNNKFHISVWAVGGKKDEPCYCPETSFHQTGPRAPCIPRSYSILTIFVHTLLSNLLKIKWLGGTTPRPDNNSRHLEGKCSGEAEMLLVFSHERPAHAVRCACQGEEVLPDISLKSHEVVCSWTENYAV